MIAARETCHALGLPHVTLDLREEFRRAVVEPFVRGYARGETPNPCVRCNGSFRFAELLDLRRRAGAEKLWTGHYARIVEHRGRRLLARGADARTRISRTCWRRSTRASSTASSSRSASRTRRRPAPRRPPPGSRSRERRESQEACFLAGDDYRAFLGRHGLEAAEGPIVDESGTELGRHEGYWRYTPGQRRGIGVAAAEPLYALRTDAGTNTVVVGPRAALAATRVDARGRLHVPVEHVHAKLRYRSPAVPARVDRARPNGFRLELEQPAYGVATGPGGRPLRGRRRRRLGCGLRRARV